VLVKVSKWFLVVALCASIVTHWSFLQSVAWVGMAITYSQDSSSFTEALAKTFDGKHPCKLCKFVAEGKKSEKKHQAQLKILKLDVFSPVRSQFVFISPKPDHYNSPASVALDHTEAPPTPPPRLT